MSQDGQRPVFIIGGSRTGSTMLQTILGRTPALSITDEIQYLVPGWLHQDFVQDIHEHVGPLDANGALDRLVDLMYSGKSFGWYWSATDRLLDRDMIRAQLATEPLTIRHIFDSILTVHARMRDKARIGAKFPVHYSYARQLLEWYPDCLLIHTTRNPKAVYASQANKYLKDKGLAGRLWMRLRQFVHINIQISWTARVHRQLRDLPNYMLSRYEDLVTDPEPNIRALCKFVDIEFQDDMVAPRQFGSSFENRPDGAGMNQQALERWKTTISPLTARFIDIFHFRAMRLLGYGSD